METKPAKIKVPIATKILPYGKLGTSYSYIDTFRQCPYRWHRAVMLGESFFEESPAMVYGKLIHKVIQEAIRSGFTLSKEELSEVYMTEAYRRKLDFWEKEDNKKADNDAHNFIDWIDHVSKRPKEELTVFEKAFFHGKSETELKFDFKISLRRPIVVNGDTYDTITMNGRIDQLSLYEDEYYIIDHKTGKKYSEDKISDDLQLHVYSLACLKKNKKLPKRCYYNFVREPNNRDEVIFMSENEKNRAVDTLKDVFDDMFYSKEYEAKPSALCYWCPFGKYNQNKCKNSSDYKPNK